VQDLADTMTFVIESESLSKIKIENGQKYIRDNLSVESQIVKYEQLYKDVIG
jgi:hypothetical protein